VRWVSVAHRCGLAMPKVLISYRRADSGAIAGAALRRGLRLMDIASPGSSADWHHEGIEPADVIKASAACGTHAVCAARAQF